MNEVKSSAILRKIAEMESELEMFRERHSKEQQAASLKRMRDRVIRHGWEKALATVTRSEECG